MWQILSTYSVQETHELEFRRLLLSAITWLRQRPGLVDARTFQYQDPSLHFCSWVAWESLSAHYRALQSVLWSRILATMQPALRDQPGTHLLETILYSSRLLPPDGPAALAVVRGIPGADEVCREPVMRFCEKVAHKLDCPRLTLGRSIEDRSTFVALFDLPAALPPCLPLPEDEAVKSVEWCLPEPVRSCPALLRERDK